MCMYRNCMNAETDSIEASSLGEKEYTSTHFLSLKSLTGSEEMQDQFHLLNFIQPKFNVLENTYNFLLTS